MTQINLLNVGFLSFAVILQLLSVAIPYWLKSGPSNYGLWQVCFEGSCRSFTNKTDVFRSLQSLEILGLLAGIFGIVTIVDGIYTKILRPRLSRLLTAVHCIAAGAFILIGIIQWCIKTYGLSACFAMSLISSFTCGIIGGRFTISDEH